MTRFGILSTAQINYCILEAAAASSELEVVAVASRTQERADAYARERGIARAYGSYDALLADDTIDAVYISLPNSLHCEWSIRALEAGKHVLCEKPMSSSPAEVEAVFDVADACDRRCMEAFMWRHNPQTRRLEQLVADGAIGELRLVRSAFTYPMVDGESTVQMRPELDGGALMDIGCYPISAMRLVAGEPTAASARELQGTTGVDVRTVASLTLPDDVLAQLTCAFDLPERDELELLGSEGSIRVADPWHGEQPGIELVRDGRTEQISFAPGDSYRLQLENFARAIRGVEPQLLGREDAVGQARAIGLIRSAIRRGAEA
jgi:xylose dehydrogenase (NAD/NADP)